MEFLSIIQEQFPGYFTETFPDVIRIDKGSHLSKVTLFVTAPFLSAGIPASTRSLSCAFEPKGGSQRKTN
ncbi:Uncharacterized protein FKW44_000317 [Caligus rogercresseyi]|uniref:Uncharacterized protein n=1 Tax=Caligus rogercresseyi TaxID=217165 RepID=A0A7T8KHD0_CALRO|nr:Uncharacterized protein FKW44_000317 [Caligus rogercresseyi]